MAWRQAPLAGTVNATSANCEAQQLLLATRRGDVKLFKKLDALTAFVRDMGIEGIKTELDIPTAGSIGRAPASEVPLESMQIAPTPVAPATGKARTLTAELRPLNFRMPLAFDDAFRDAARERRMKLNEFLSICFEYWRASNPKSKGPTVIDG